MRTIRIETTLPTDAERVWRAMQHPASFTYVVRGLFAFPPLAGRTEPVRDGETGIGRLRLFHLIPLWRHSMRIDVDAGDRSLHSQEHGGVLKTWNHTLHVEPLSERQCRYSDTVEFDAGRFDAMTAAFATWFYRHRQRRWHKLVHTHLLPEGPRYTHSPPS
ncbi:hypothetical protein [Actinomadura sp. 9N407]|uniref:hypothetical protein n=1 Tax=Actinomadura sp. 9N407 TaxID=3375154 RepID=UPI0037A74167